MWGGCGAPRARGVFHSCWSADSHLFGGLKAANDQLAQIKVHSPLRFLANDDELARTYAQPEFAREP